MQISEQTGLRQRLKAGGYCPIPVQGKIPVLKSWQQKSDANAGEIELWQTLYATATNTGILTARTPTIDIDILDPEAAEAVEALAREHFEEHGDILVRIGKPPKRAILLRTDEPFAKITRNLTAPNGNVQKIEMLCEGQQVVVAGIHPETGLPYRWHGGEPGSVTRDSLPYVRQADCVAFADAAAALLVAQFGYQETGARPKTNGNGGERADPCDWTWLLANIHAGRDLHDSTVTLAAKLITSGMSDGAAVNLIRAAFEASTAPRDARFDDRFADIPRAVNSARQKLAKPAPETLLPSSSLTLVEVVKVFQKWLVLPDPTPVYVVLGTVAANLLPGDPVWLGVIAPPSSAKTELLNATSRLPNVLPAATLTPAALLSGTPKRETAAGAKGGLLRQIGEFGILILKDFGSVLSMRPDAKAEVLAALREIFDGAWTRHLGTDGGKTLAWAGKLGLIFGATEAYDDHHSVIGSLGDRFLLYRLGPSYGGQLKMALKHTGGSTKTMRAELADAVAGLFTVELQEPPSPSDDEVEKLDAVVALAVKLRAHVNRDRYSREIESVHGAEGPGRLGLCLERLLAGLCVIGLDRRDALRVIVTVALNSVPPARRKAFELLSTTAQETRVIANNLKLPTNTTRRVLEDVAAQGLAIRSRATVVEDGGEDQKQDDKKKKREKKGGPDLWSVHPDWIDWSAKWQTL